MSRSRKTAGRRVPYAGPRGKMSAEAGTLIAGSSRSTGRKPA
jgi:hypothetical protein